MVTTSKRVKKNIKRANKQSARAKKAIFLENSRFNSQKAFLVELSRLSSKKAISSRHLSALKLRLRTVYDGKDFNQFFGDMLNIAQNGPSRTQILELRKNEHLRRLRLPQPPPSKNDKTKSGGRNTSTSDHLQKRIFDQIQTDPKEYYSETSDDCRRRAENISEAMDGFDAEVRKYAEFNIKFFETLASEQTTFEPLELPDDKGFFRWPNTEVIMEVRYGPAVDIDAEDAGVLSVIGYNARADGPADMARRRILEALFIGQMSIPNTLPDYYIAEWGKENSIARLRKMAFSIASFSRQQKRKRNGSEQAIQKWESDLVFLKSRFYKPFATHFNWPAT